MREWSVSDGMPLTMGYDSQSSCLSICRRWICDLSLQCDVSSSWDKDCAHRWMGSRNELPLDLALSETIGSLSQLQLLQIPPVDDPNFIISWHSQNKSPRIRKCRRHSNSHFTSSSTHSNTHENEATQESSFEGLERSTSASWIIWLLWFKLCTMCQGSMERGTSSLEGTMG